MTAKKIKNEEVKNTANNILETEQKLDKTEHKPKHTKNTEETAGAGDTEENMSNTVLIIETITEVNDNPNTQINEGHNHLTKTEILEEIKYQLENEDEIVEKNEQNGISGAIIDNDQQNVNSNSNQNSNKVVKINITEYFLPVLSMALGFAVLISLFLKLNNFQADLNKTQNAVIQLSNQNNRLEKQIQTNQKTFETKLAEIQNRPVPQPLNQPGQPDPAVQQPARPTTGTTAITGQPFLGNKDGAKVAIVEFSDFECPFCKQHHSTAFDTIIKEFVDTGKIIYVAKDLPLPFHQPLADYQAKAGECVFKQLGNQKYFEYVKNIYATTTSGGTGMATAKVDEIATKAGATNLVECMALPETTEAIRKDQTDAGQAGVNGTPGFIVGVVGPDGNVTGQIVSGASSFEGFKTVIDSQLALAK